MAHTGALGYSVSISEDTIIAGAFGTDANGIRDSGAAYAFVLDSEFFSSYTVPATGGVAGATLFFVLISLGVAKIRR